MIKRLYQQAKKTVKDISHDEITVYSAQASYYIAMSSFPFTILLLSLANLFMPGYRSVVLGSINSLIPNSIQPDISILTKELFEKSVPIMSISLITTLWSSSRGLAAAERGIRRVYKVEKKHNFIINTLFSMLYTVIFIGLLLITLLLQVFSNTLLDFADVYTIISDTQLILIKTLLFFSVMSLAFTIIYYFFSQRYISFSKHIPGACVTTVGWMAFSQLYSLYIDNFTSYSYIYGSITAIALIMLWLYCCMFIMLIGAEINRFIYNKRGL